MAAGSGNVFLRSLSNKTMINFSNFRYWKRHYRCPERLSQSMILRTCATSTVAAADSGHSCFENMVRERRRQIRRSILVHVYSKFVVGNLYNYCSKYGSVTEANYYSLPNAKDFVLLEFENEQSVEALLRETKHFDSHNVIPVQSRCLWYHETTNSNENACPHVRTTCPTPEAEIMERLRAATSMSNQINVLHEGMRLTDLQQRLRFFACHQLEMAFSGLFSNCTVLPFGSSVNGFGKHDCDLDMVMSLGDDHVYQTSPVASNKLFYHTKRSLANNRVQTQRHLESISDVIHSFFPGCGSVHRILQARVPIIKFNHELINADCDLTMSNLSGVYMSELLYLYGEMDVRVRPLVTVILKWAKENGLTQVNPGRWVTNFSLILMVLSFLQARSNPLLPSLGVLQKSAVAADQRSSEGIDCSFVRNLERFPVMDSPAELGDLLLEFFTYYSNFDFKRFGVSLGTGGAIPKPDYSALYIHNPLERELNVSKNVNADEVERIQERMKMATAALETSARPSGQEAWGLLKLFENLYVGPSQRTFPVSAFFDGGGAGLQAEQSPPKIRNPAPSNAVVSGGEGKPKRLNTASDDLVSRLVLNKMSGRSIKWTPGQAKKGDVKPKRSRRPATTDSRWIF